MLLPILRLVVFSITPKISVTTLPINGKDVQKDFCSVRGSSEEKKASTANMSRTFDLLVTSLDALPLAC